jgi:hypothetical protein
VPNSLLPCPRCLHVGLIKTCLLFHMGLSDCCSEQNNTHCFHKFQRAPDRYRRAGRRSTTKVDLYETSYLCRHARMRQKNVVAWRRAIVLYAEDVHFRPNVLTLWWAMRTGPTCQLCLRPNETKERSRRWIGLPICSTEESLQPRQGLSQRKRLHSRPC